MVLSGVSAGVVGQIVDYGVPGGTFVVEGVIGARHHSELFVFDYEWSHT